TIENGNLVVAGFVRPGVTLDLYVSSPGVGAQVGYGQGQQYLTSLVEGSAADLDTTTGSYGPAQVNGVAVGSDATNRFRFALPLASLPPEVRTGALLTSVALGSTSEFGNAVPIGQTVANGAPQVFPGPDALLSQGDRFDQDGYFTDPDSSSWTAIVDYGDG